MLSGREDDADILIPTLITARLSRPSGHPHTAAMA